MSLFLCLRFCGSPKSGESFGEVYRNQRSGKSFGRFYEIQQIGKSSVLFSDSLSDQGGNSMPMKLSDFSIKFLPSELIFNVTKGVLFSSLSCSFSFSINSYSSCDNF